MTNLRQRIFKRVKPKVLNGQFITGEMFLELCIAYTDAINKGSIPCIESAWTYLCQNECQRVMQEAIANYERELHKAVFPSKKSNSCENYNVLKQAHKQIKESSLEFFR